ncbi:aromatic-ring-hydroxylating dioxygenase subunit beta [Comamonas testosteroni]|uniref:Terephthalate 1,2-dioxygenase n=1 Tax=Comamonas testosteroni TaxID=285 RepID=A0A096HGL9_COMTE|nr:aromatic-ring-hydroxylating dioxygenase subunit beta [Comamonas testosteroni]KGH28012.1 terephthalate 1,2-dioxygenase [Comamonas testosteroni]
MNRFELHMAVSLLNAAYADCIDSDRLEAWPDFFTSDCFYSITTQENLARGWEAGLIFADSQGMLKDRVSGLREANIYERHNYRHIVSMPAAIDADGEDTVRARTPFAVYRVMRNGSSEVFVTGCYQDELRVQDDGELKIARRVVVCDSSVFDILLAIPL